MAGLNRKPPLFWDESSTAYLEDWSAQATTTAGAPAPVVNLVKEFTPHQLREVQAEGANLLKLAPGWDGHDGKIISQDAYRFLLHILDNILPGHPRIPAPQIVPLSYGGVQAEWHTWHVDFEIEVERVQRFRWYFRDRHNKTDEEGYGGTDFGALQDWLARI